LIALTMCARPVDRKPFVETIIRDPAARFVAA
jgi:hypothetical protein